MQARLKDEYGNTWHYEQENGMSLFRNRDTRELRQDIAGAPAPRGRGWEQINLVPAILPVQTPPAPPDTSALPLSQRIAKEIGVAFPPAALACLVELAKRVELLEAVTGL